MDVHPMPLLAAQNIGLYCQEIIPSINIGQEKMGNEPVVDVSCF
jgi:hypothetical protein